MEGSADGIGGWDMRTFHAIVLVVVTLGLMALIVMCGGCAPMSAEQQAAVNQACYASSAALSNYSAAIASRPIPPLPPVVFAPPVQIPEYHPAPPIAIQPLRY